MTDTPIIGLTLILSNMTSASILFPSIFIALLASIVCTAAVCAAMAAPNSRRTVMPTVQAIIFRNFLISLSFLLQPTKIQKYIVKFAFGPLRSALL